MSMIGTTHLTREVLAPESKVVILEQAPVVHASEASHKSDEPVSSTMSKL